MTVLVFLDKSRVRVGESTQAGVQVGGVVAEGDATPVLPIAWSSFSPSVASVTAMGVVRALAKGNAQIVARVGDNWAAAQIQVKR